jgi:hypothetical protein
MIFAITCLAGTPEGTRASNCMVMIPKRMIFSRGYY